MRESKGRSSRWQRDAVQSRERSALPAGLEVLRRGRRGVWMLTGSMVEIRMMLGKRYCPSPPKNPHPKTTVSYAVLYHNGRHREERGREGAGRGYTARPGSSERRSVDGVGTRRQRACMRRSLIRWCVCKDAGCWLVAGVVETNQSAAAGGLTSRDERRQARGSRVSSPPMRRGKQMVGKTVLAFSLGRVVGR